MADIAFLLVIFFVLCSTAAKEAGITVHPPESRDIDELEQTRIVVIIDDKKEIYVEGRKVATPKEVESELTVLLQDAANERDRTVLFRCDREVPKNVFEPVMDAIARAGGLIAAVGEEGGE
jgi:biopolymer transport protein ExbD